MTPEAPPTTVRTTCKMMVPTQPEVGDADRHPPPHQCRRPVYADGYCATHSAEYQERRKAEQAAREARYEEDKRKKGHAAEPRLDEMTMRDLMAMFALMRVRGLGTVATAKEAYAQADAMIEERKPK